MLRNGYSAFQLASFRLLWSSSLAGAGAQWMERVATGWLALETGGEPWAVGVVLAARSLPALLLGLASGTLADRHDRRRLLMAVAVAGSGLAVTLGLLVRGGAVSLWQVALIAFLSGCVNVADMPARQALVVDLVGRRSAANAVALNAVATRFCSAVGALLGGFIIPTFGVANCYFVVAGGFLLSLGFLAALRAERPAPRLGAVPPFREALLGTSRLIFSNSRVRTLALATMACEVFGFSYQTAMPTFARDVLLAGPTGFGLLSAAGSLGATLAVIGLAALPGSVRREPLLTAVYLFYGLGLVALAVAPSLTVAILVVLVVGACAAAFDTLQQALVQLAVPEEQRGSAMGIWVLGLGAGPAGHLETGLLSTAVGTPLALSANGILVASGALLLALRAPAFRGRRVVETLLSAGH